MSVDRALRKINRRKGPKKYTVSKLIDVYEDLIPEAKIPGILHFEFRENIDIVNVYRTVYSKLIYQSRKVDSLRVDLRKLDANIIMTKSSCSRTVLQVEREKLAEIIADWSDKEKIETYKIKSETFIATYRQLPQRITTVDIVENESRDYIPTQEDYDRIQVIVNFLEFSKQFVDLTYICRGYHPIETIVKCKCCQLVIDNVPVYNDVRTCPSCGLLNTYRVTDDEIVSYGDSTNKHRSYEDIANFRKTFKRFLGEIRPKVDLDVLRQDLDQYFEEKGMMVGEYVKSLDTTYDGKKEGTNVSQMIDALKATGYSSCYDDVNYIMYDYWGWNLPDASHLEEIIMNDYQLTQNVWYGMSEAEKGRKSSISTHYRLFKHLQIRGYNCSICDFKMPQSQSIQSYDRIWKIMVENCGEPALYFIPT